VSTLATGFPASAGEASAEAQMVVSKKRLKAVAASTPSNSSAT